MRPRVLLTRAAAAGSEWIRALEAAGYTVTARSLIRTTPIDDLRGLQRYRDGAGFAWIAFSSRRGVTHFFEALERHGAERPSLGQRFAVVGPSTRLQLEGHGYEKIVEAESPDAAGLAASIAARIGPGERVLRVRPEGAAGEFESDVRAAGGTVVDWVLYRTEAGDQAAATSREVGEQRFDAVVLTSPSSLRALVEGTAEGAGALRATPLVALGASTAAAISARTLPVAGVARRPDPRGVVAALARLFRCATIAPFSLSRSVLGELDTVKKTALHDVHVAAGARMVDFAGWRMPVQYEGVLVEHAAVRGRAGLFDVSHMGQARITGPQAVELLQYLTCNDVSKLTPGKVHYNGLMTSAGCFVDDFLIYALEDGDYLAVLNAANVAKDLEWMRRHAADFDAEVIDESDRWALLALQGPRAEAILTPLSDQVGDLAYYHCRSTTVAGVRCLLSRTGYTGEDGFEIYAPPERAADLWGAVMSAGAGAGVVAVGLGARDTLRLEAKMALYGNDIDETTTALEADLGWIVKLTKGEFVGRDALVRQTRDGVNRRLVGFEMDSRAIARHGYPALRDGREVGRVTSGSYAPHLDRRIGLAYLPVEMCGTGTRFDVGIRGRAEPARVVPTPFYKKNR